MSSCSFQSWHAYFGNIKGGARPDQAYQAPPSLSTKHVPASAVVYDVGAHVIKDHQNVQALIRSYQIRGHCLAKLDPLDISNRPLSDMPPELNINNYFPEPSDLDKVFQLPTTTFIGDRSHNEDTLPLREILSRLQKAYCGSIGVEYMFINSKQKCESIGYWTSSECVLCSRML